ncbi:hypothetical protein [Microbacterium testaceum]
MEAEVTSFDGLVEVGSVAEARAKGKDNVMQDGDVAEFRHS